MHWQHDVFFYFFILNIVEIHMLIVNVNQAVYVFLKTDCWNIAGSQAAESQGTL